MRERTIDRDVARLAGGSEGSSSSPSPAGRQAGNSPRPSSYAPSGETPKSFEFGAPMQEAGKPRPLVAEKPTPKRRLPPGVQGINKD